MWRVEVGSSDLRSWLKSKEDSGALAQEGNHRDWGVFCIDWDEWQCSRHLLVSLTLTSHFQLSRHFIHELSHCPLRAAYRGQKTCFCGFHCLTFKPLSSQTIRKSFLVSTLSLPAVIYLFLRKGQKVGKDSQVSRGTQLDPTWRSWRGQNKNWKSEPGYPVWGPWMSCCAILVFLPNPQTQLHPHWHPGSAPQSSSLGSPSLS